MMEYGVWNPVTGEQDIWFGYDFKDAARRNHADPNDWEIEYAEYID